MRIFNSLRLLIIFLVGFICHGQENTINATVEVDAFGNMYVNNTISNLHLKRDTIIVDSKLLIHKNQATLIGSTRLGKRRYTQYTPKTSNFSFVVNLPKGKNDSYRKTRQFFLGSIGYLAEVKEEYSRKKKFNIEVKVPKGFTLVYPTKADLEKKHRFTPAIIAGDFYKRKIKGFDVYNLNRNKANSAKVDSIIAIVNEAYNFYTKSYPSLEEKPKIIFVPFVSKTLLGLTSENKIILSSKMLRPKAKLQEKLLAHEVAHLFWGDAGLRFKERVLTEGVSEYMALKYLEFKNQDSIIKSTINKKRYRIEGRENANIVTKKVKSKDFKNLSYELSPLLFYFNEKSNADLYPVLADFYKLNSANQFTLSLKDLQEFLKLKNLTLLDDNILPDFYITETKNEIIINGLAVKDTKIELEKLLSDGSKEMHTLSFSYDNEKYTFSKKNLEKATLDPKYKVLQFSRLNDVWIKNETSYSSKNRYFELEDVNPKVLSISNQILRYLEAKDDLILNDLTCESNVLLRDSYKKLKASIYKNEADGFVITGASTFFKKGANSMFIKMVYFSKTDYKSKLVSLRLYIDKELNFVQRFKIL